MSRHKIPFIDLFCGAGGLSVGFEQAGFKAVFANDNDLHACSTYAANHPAALVHCGDVERLSGADILKQTGLAAIPLIIGGPNCQGVSLRGKRDPHDPKNRMFFHFKRLIEELQPEWFVMENVPGLLHKHNRDLISAIFGEFEGIGYNCGGEVLLAADYGVPQLRYRFVLIGSRKGKEILFPDATHACPLELDNAMLFSTLTKSETSSENQWLTVRDAIGDLPRLKNGSGALEIPYPSPEGQDLTEYQRLMRHRSRALHNHICHKTPDHNIELIKHIPQGKNWKSIPEELRPARFKHVALKDHTTTFGRLRWDMPARTITTYFNNISAGAFTHPTQHRGISVREGARLQSFPDAFKFTGPLSRQYRQVGNAVPPLMAKQIAKVMHEYITRGEVKRQPAHCAAVHFEPHPKVVRITRPLLGMRFNLDRYLVQA